MSAHTQGDWSAVVDRTNGHGGWSIVAGGTAHIATVYADEYASPPYPPFKMLELNQVSHANARLIAAAPRMLAALQYIAGTYAETDEGAWMAQEARDAIDGVVQP